VDTSFTRSLSGKKSRSGAVRLYCSKIRTTFSSIVVRIPKSLLKISKYAGCARVFLLCEANFCRHTCAYGKKMERSMAEKGGCRQRVERF